MKRILKIIGLIMRVIFFGLAGWLVGAYFGGNYFADFAFGGLRGYEATGMIGCILGFLLGIISCRIVFD